MHRRTCLSSMPPRGQRKTNRSGLPPHNPTVGQLEMDKGWLLEGQSDGCGVGEGGAGGGGGGCGDGDVVGLGLGGLGVGGVYAVSAGDGG